MEFTLHNFMGRIIIVDSFYLFCECVALIRAFNYCSVYSSMALIFAYGTNIHTNYIIDTNCPCAVNIVQMLYETFSMLDYRK